MKERPILFSAPMVRTLLDGSKTQTRRVVKDQPQRGNWPWPPMSAADHEAIARHCPYGQPGEHLYVRETTLRVEDHGYVGPVYVESDEGRACLEGGLAPSADDCTEVEPYEIRKRPAIHMPRAMSRINLAITAVRVERLQDISYEDAIAEGISNPAHMRAFPASLMRDESVEQYARRSAWPQRMYRTLWEDINGAGSWAANPWVWVVAFKRAPWEGGA